MSSTSRYEVSAPHSESVHGAVFNGLTMVMHGVPDDPNPYDKIHSVAGVLLVEPTIYVRPLGETEKVVLGRFASQEFVIRGVSVQVTDSRLGQKTSTSCHK